MIRINLLPFRAARKKESIRKQVSVFALMVLFFIVALFYYTTYVDKKIDKIKIDIAGVKTQISKYKKAADKVTKIKKDLENLNKKLDTISNLQSKRRVSVALLDEMTHVIVPEKMWLTSLKSNKTNVILKGVAFDNKTVADFMIKLEDSALFSDVDLKNLKMKKFADNLQMKEFEIICKKQVSGINQKEKKVKK